LAEPLRELVIVSEGMMYGIATLYSDSASIKPSELRVRVHGTVIKLDEPCILLLDNRGSTALPWEVPVAALDTEAVKISVRQIAARRPNNFAALQEVKTLKLPGF
jgi:hypothetical protein